MRKLGSIKILKECEESEYDNKNDICLIENDSKYKIRWFCESKEKYKYNKIYLEGIHRAKIVVEDHKVYECITKNNFDVNTIDNLTELHMISKIKRILPQQEIYVVEKNNNRNFYRIK